VNGLVLTESILMKRLSMRSRTNFNLAEAGIPKIVPDILCTPATDDAMLALNCGERDCVFEGAAGQLYSSLPGPNWQMTPAIRNFFEDGVFLWINRDDGLSYTEEDAKQDIENGTAKVFIHPTELKRRQEGVLFGSLFALVLTQLTVSKVWPTVLGPLEALVQVEEITGVKPAVCKVMTSTYEEMCDPEKKRTANTFFDVIVSF